MLSPAQSIPCNQGNQASQRLPPNINEFLYRLMSHCTYLQQQQNTYKIDSGLLKVVASVYFIYKIFFAFLVESSKAGN